MKIDIVTTGGTIDKIYFDAKSDYQIGKPVIGELLERMGVTLECNIIPLMRKDSLDLTDNDRLLIVETVKNAASDHVLVTHGTDSMVETGKWLQQHIPQKHMVLTGALQPAAFRETDAVFNIGCALGALQQIGHGAYVAMNGQVFDVLKVRKNFGENRFEVME